jgi:predicted ABC-type ATPase
MPVMHLIAGPHGAGKSTLYQCLVGPRHPGLPYVDGQAWAASQGEHLPDLATRALAARLWADEARQALLKQGQSFASETTFSHPSRVALIAQARSMGFEVVLYVLALDEPRRLLQRVSKRTRDGGPPIPSHKVLERYARCLYNLRQAVFMADLAFLFDAVDTQAGGPRLIASLAAGQMQLLTVPRPRWVEKMLGFSEG